MFFGLGHLRLHGKHYTAAGVADSGKIGDAGKGVSEPAAFPAADGFCRERVDGGRVDWLFEVRFRSGDE